MIIAFSIFEKKNDLCIIYDTLWNQGHIQGKTKQWNIAERSIFLEKIKMLLQVCSTSIVNLWKTLLLIPVYIDSFLV